MVRRYGSLRGRGPRVTVPPRARHHKLPARAACGLADDRVQRDRRMLTEADLNRYVEGLERNGGFTVPNWYYQTSGRPRCS